MLYNYYFKRRDKTLSALAKLRDVAGLTFFKDYANSQASANADYSVGVGTATIAVTRTTGHPGTYVTDQGLVSYMAATDNTARFTKGFYSDKGFVRSSGLLVELAATNLLLYSSDMTQAEWAKTNGTVSSNDATAPDGTATADSFTATAANATILQAQTITSAVKTFSIFLKRKTGTGSVSLTIDGGSTYTEVFLSTANWKRFQITQTLANPSVGIKISTSGDAVYAWGAQNETMNFMTSYIPTTTAAVTRNKETFSYATADNRTAATETFFFSFTPNWSGTDISATSGNPRLLDTVTKSRVVFASTTDFVNYQPNITDNSGVIATQTTILQKNVPYVVAGSSQFDANPATTVKIYYDGTSQHTSTTNFTSTAWGVSFYVGASAAAASQLCGIVHAVAFYSSVLSDGVVASLSAILQRPKPQNVYYVDATLGVDTNDGLTPDEPWRTVAKVNARTNVAGDIIKFKCGETWREQITAGQGGTVAGGQITYTNYGTGNLPRFCGGDLVTGFSDLGSNKWEAALSASTSPLAVLFNGSIRGRRRASVAALVQEYDFFWTANVLTVYATSDPDSRYSTIEASIRTSGFSATAKNYLTIDGLSCEVGQGDGIAISTSGTGIIIKNCSAKYNANDGINANGTSPDLLIQSNISHYNGQGRGVGGGAGDGISLHDTCAGIIEYNDVRYNDKAGIDNIDETETIVRYNWVQGNDMNITLGGITDAAESAATMDVYYNVIVCESNDSHGIALCGTALNTPTLEAYNNTIYGNGAGTGILSRTAGTLTAKNNIVIGMAKGIDQNADTTITADYNLVYNNTIQYEGVSAGANDRNTDPLFVDASEDNFHLQAASPAVNKGVDVSLTRDYDGNSIVGVPDIGAFEYQGA